MTHQEKAEELIDKFRIFVGTSEDEDGRTINNYLVGKKAARMAAIICVEEIIEVVKQAHTYLGVGEIGLLKHYIPYQYWNKVLNILKSDI